MPGSGYLTRVDNIFSVSINRRIFLILALMTTLCITFLSLQAIATRYWHIDCDNLSTVNQTGNTNTSRAAHARHDLGMSSSPSPTTRSLGVGIFQLYHAMPRFIVNMHMLATVSVALLGIIILLLFQWAHRSGFRHMTGSISITTLKPTSDLTISTTLKVARIKRKLLVGVTTLWFVSAIVLLLTTLVGQVMLIISKWSDGHSMGRSVDGRKCYISGLIWSLIYTVSTMICMHCTVITRRYINGYKLPESFTGLQANCGENGGGDAMVQDEESINMMSSTISQGGDQQALLYHTF